MSASGGRPLDDEDRPPCGKPMIAYEVRGIAVTGDPVCGRPGNHHGPCRSVAALQREAEASARRQPRPRPAGSGMTPAERETATAAAEILARVKRIAQPYANAVQSRSRHHVGLLTAGLTQAELCALTVVLADAADLDLLRLIVAADDNGMVSKPPGRKGNVNAA